MTRKFDRHLILLLALSAFAWLPLVTPGYFMRAHDAPHSLFFLQAFDEAVRDGQWWPAWGPNFAFGYGYPLWIFYAPLTYYIGEAFHVLGANITTAMKLVDLIATTGATISMYLWARSHFNQNAAAFAAIVYTYAPYHLLDLYVRSAVAEYFTFVWFPLVLWRWERLLRTPTRGNTLLAAWVTAALILTHHGAAFIFAILLGAYMLFLMVHLHLTKYERPTTDNSRQSSSVLRLAYALAAGLLTLGLSAIFWLPLLLEQKYIVVEQWTSVAYNYQKHFIFANQFFSPFWGFGYSDEWLNDGMAFQLGLMPIVGGVVAWWLSKRQPPTADRGRIVFFLTASAVSVVLMSSASAGFWQVLPFAALVQFPWRLLALSTITLAWLAGAAVEAVGSEQKAVSSIESDPANCKLPTAYSALLMLVVVLASFNYTLPQYTERSAQGESARAAVDFELVSYKDRTGYMTWASQQPQSSPLVAEYQTGAPLTKAIALGGGAQIEPLHHGGQSERVRVRSASEATIQFRIYYFPGWRARIDGQPVSLWPSGPQALITLAAPAGDHVVDLQFEDTNVRGLAKGISLASVLLAIGWLFVGTKDGGRRTKVVSFVVGLSSFIFFVAACDSNNSAPSPTTSSALTPQPNFSAVAVAPPTATAQGTSTATPTTTPQTAPTPRPATTQHIVQPNETLGGIAQIYGTTVEAILKANNLSDPRLLRAGQTLIIPLPTLTPTPTATPTLDATQAALPPTPTPIIYVVQSGDVLSAIAAKYNLPVDEIMAANGLNDTFLRAGQPLVIPGPTPTPTITLTPLPTVTPTPGLAFGEPALLFPADGARFSSDDQIVLNWTAVGTLAADQYYVLRLRTVDGATHSESLWLKTPSYRLPANWRGAQIEWDVIVLQVTKTNADGTREGKIQSPFSTTRQFTWR